MPVAAVIAGGRSSVSSGSANTAFASNAGENTIFFTCVVSSDTTLERPTSEPVPAVGGSATKEGRAAGLERLRALHDLRAGRVAPHLCEYRRIQSGKLGLEGCEQRQRSDAAV